MSEEQPEKTCPMCIGTGKVRDYKIDPSGFPASTNFVVDPLKIGLGLLSATYGT